ncbi:MAG: DUF2939 domain-containing protein [Proteobacteria bacterium]|nr:DUF2939 domain-containing protein [Pseudomonadota bacterium]
MRLSAIVPVLAAAALTAAALALSGCATTQRLSAAPDVHALLIAIRDDDRQAFDAHVDRKALEAQLQSRLVERTRGASVDEAWKALGLVLSGPISRLAGDLLIQPDVFRAVAEYYGYRPGTPIPNSLIVAGALKALPDGRVCATRRKHDDCLMTFADEGGIWRLVGFDGDAALLRMKP